MPNTPSICRAFLAWTLDSAVWTGDRTSKSNTGGFQPLVDTEVLSLNHNEAADHVSGRVVLGRPAAFGVAI